MDADLNSILDWIEEEEETPYLELFSFYLELCQMVRNGVPEALDVKGDLLSGVHAWKVLKECQDKPALAPIHGLAQEALEALNFEPRTDWEVWQTLVETEWLCSQKRAELAEGQILAGRA